MDIVKELNGLFNLGQTYWQQADSEYVSQHKKSDETHEKARFKMAELAKYVRDIKQERDEATSKLAAMESKEPTARELFERMGHIADDEKCINLLAAALADKPAVAVPDEESLLELFHKEFKIPEGSDISWYSDREQFLTKLDQWKAHAKGMTSAFSGFKSGAIAILAAPSHSQQSAKTLPTNSADCAIALLEGAQARNGRGGYAENLQPAIDLLMRARCPSHESEQP